MQIKKNHFSGVSNIHHTGPNGLASLLNSKLDSDSAALAAVVPIADPEDATAEDVATAFNALLAALKPTPPVGG